MAYVKYSDQGEEYVPVSQIWLDKKRTQPYVPQNEKDFQSNIKYVVRSSKYRTPAGDPLKLKGYILKLAGKLSFLGITATFSCTR